MYSLIQIDEMDFKSVWFVNLRLEKKKFNL